MGKGGEEADGEFVSERVERRDRAQGEDGGDEEQGRSRSNAALYRWPHTSLIHFVNYATLLSLIADIR